MPDRDDAARRRDRETWAAGEWDSFSDHTAPVGIHLLERIALEPGMDLLDVGTGSGGTVAIPAAARGAKVVGSDVTPEHFEHARRRAGQAGVEIEWIEADAQDLPFAAASFDRVTSTFGAMFAPDHRRAAAELVRVCRPDGLVAMTTWASEGFAPELFKLSSSFMPPPPEGFQPPMLWGVEAHVAEMFAAAGARAEISHETVVFEWPTPAAAVHQYLDKFGPIVMLRGVLEPQGRWPEYAEAFAQLVERLDSGTGSTRLSSDYLLTIARR
jgi:ubiquinone/menaquinone biosynthesis C-methylase UbiE